MILTSMTGKRQGWASDIALQQGGVIISAQWTCVHTRLRVGFVIEDSGCEVVRGYSTPVHDRFEFLVCFCI